MARLSLAITLASCLLNTIVQASNPVFGAYITPSCDSCLDQTYLSCPGDYQTAPYGQCMCYGDGGTMVNQCLSMCDYSINEPENVVATWYGYCVIFFKDMCAEAANYISETRYNDECSPEAIAAGGLGDSVSSSDSGSESTSSASATGNRASTNPTSATSAKTATTTGTATAARSTASTSGGTTAQPTSGAMAVPVPALALMAGLGMQLITLVNL